MSDMVKGLMLVVRAIGLAIVLGGACGLIEAIR